MLVHRALIGVDYSATCGDKTWFVINEELEIAVKYSTCTCTCRNGSLTTRATLQIQKKARCSGGCETGVYMTLRAMKVEPIQIGDSKGHFDTKQDQIWRCCTSAILS